MIKTIKEMIRNYYLEKCNLVLEEINEHYEIQAEYGNYPANSFIAYRLKVKEAFAELYLAMAEIFEDKTWIE